MAKDTKVYNVLFLCTGNSARSIFAEAPELDFVFTVCDNAAGEVCPVWPGSPVTAHWGVPDPVAAEGDELARKNAFRTAYRQLENRIRLFVNLRIRELDRLTLKRKVDEIGDLDRN